MYIKKGTVKCFATIRLLMMLIHDLRVRLYRVKGFRKAQNVMLAINVAVGFWWLNGGMKVLCAFINLIQTSHQ
jgi:hypothetical protein